MIFGGQTDRTKSRWQVIQDALEIGTSRLVGLTSGDCSVVIV